MERPQKEHPLVLRLFQSVEKTYDRDPSHRRVLAIPPGFAPYQPSRSGISTSEMRPGIGSCSITRYLPMGAAALP